MSIKSQNQSSYKPLPQYMRSMREEAGLSQRALGAKLHKPQSWIYNCEVGNRRVDITEFLLWAKSCGKDPIKACREIYDLLMG